MAALPRCSSLAIAKMLQCVAPDVELEWFGMVENEIRGRLAVCGGATI